MDMKITFGGGSKINAEFNGHIIKTDQPAIDGGEGSAAAPYELFLASLGTCAGIYVLRFLESRNIDPNKVRLTQRNIFDPDTGRLSDIRLEIDTDPDFPAKYHKVLTRVAAQCAVKRTLADPPNVDVVVTSESDGERLEATG